MAIALAKAVQEQRDALVRLPPHQHADMVLVTSDALPDQAQKLVLHAGQLRGHGRELLERHLAHVRSGERDAFAAVFACTERIQADQLAGKMEPHDLLLAFLVGTDRLERTVARDVDRRKRVALAEQPLALLDGSPLANDVIEFLQIIGLDTRRQTQLLQRAVSAAPADAF